LGGSLLRLGTQELDRQACLHLIKLIGPRKQGVIMTGDEAAGGQIEDQAATHFLVGLKLLLCIGKQVNIAVYGLSECYNF